MLSLCVHQRGGERKSLPVHRVYLSLYPEPTHWNCDIAKIELEGCVRYIGTRPLSRTNLIPRFFYFPISKGWGDKRTWTAKGCLCGGESKDPGNEVGARHVKRQSSFAKLSTCKTYSKKEYVSFNNIFRRVLGSLLPSFSWIQRDLECM